MNAADVVLKRNAVNQYGLTDGPVLVFGHGYGTDQTTWTSIAKSFADTHRVVLFDYVGSGKSDLQSYDELKYDSLEGYATDLIEVIDAVEAEQVVFIGHSVSGMIGAIAAMRRPELFSKLIMLCPSARYVNDGDYIGGFSREDVLGLIAAIEANQPSWAASLAPAVTARADLPEVSERVRKYFTGTAQQVATHFARVTFLSDHREKLPNIPVPCVVLQTDSDIICPPHIGKFLQERIPSCDLIQLKTAGHFVHLTEPTLITRTLESVL